MRGSFHFYLFLILTFTTCRISESSSQESLDILRDKLLESFSCEIRADLDEHCWECYIEQMVDHQDSIKGVFLQRFYWKEGDIASPWLVQFNGYGLSAQLPQSEISHHYGGNHIEVEHRFFGRSKADSIAWEDLNLKQAAADHHYLISKLAKLVKSSIITTGISKGGQAAIYHRMLYPEDVSATVAYVAPITLSIPEHRIRDFLKEIGTDECRKRIIEFQRYLLNMPDGEKLFQRLAIERKMDFNIPHRQAFEWSVLEYEFAFWQWNGACQDVPSLRTDDLSMMEELFDSGAVGFFTSSTITRLYPFFYQAYTELGMYDYDCAPLADNLQELSCPANPRDIFLKDAHQKQSYSSTMHQKVDLYLRNEAEKLIVIHGANDPWSAARPEIWSSEALFFLVEEGNHRARISNLSEDEKKRAWAAIDEWSSPRDK